MRRPLFHHHKHTGKLLHHRHTSYPVLLALVLIVGGLIFFTDRIAGADDLFVSATVPAPLPSSAPTFTSPADNTVTQNSAVQFEGTCPVITPAVIVALYEGSTLLGSGLCDTTGTFQITASLTPGTHTIVATVVTITNQTGQSSVPLHITYSPATSPNTPSTPNSPASPGQTRVPTIPEAGTVAPLDIISEKPFVTFGGNLQAEWRGRFVGGIPPYTISIAWGDGTTDTVLVSSNDLQTLSHRYRSHRLYTVTITLKDQSGLSLTRYYAALRADGAPASRTERNDLAAFLDSPIINPYTSAYIIYLCLLLTMLLMWRYEHAHYPYRAIGVPLHYPWQKNKHISSRSRHS